MEQCSVPSAVGCWFASFPFVCFVLFYFSLLNLLKTFQKGTYHLCQRSNSKTSKFTLFRDNNIYHESKCMEFKIAPCHFTALLLNGVNLGQDTSPTIEFTRIFQENIFLSFCMYIFVCLFIYLSSFHSYSWTGERLVNAERKRKEEEEKKNLRKLHVRIFACLF